VGDQALPEERGVLGPCGSPGSATSVLDFDSGKVGSANHTQLYFQEATHLRMRSHCPGWVCGVIKVIKQQTFATV